MHNGKEGSYGAYGSLLFVNGVVTEFSKAYPSVTNNQMEMLGAIIALKNIPPGHEGQDVQVTSDSQYLIKGMTEWIHGWAHRGWVTADKKPVKNKDLWLHLLKYNRMYKIDWRWIKGHAGHKHNERCDELATLAMKAFAINITP